ncbi:MAG TPA: NrsF family protein [Micropepsaceae bacterium]|nr:NrsF family protein [Micropepsaceae bacterium]
MTTTHDLIDSLARDAGPVRRLQSPLRRGFLFLAAIVGIVLAATLVTNAWPGMLSRLQDSRFAIEMSATALTGVAAILAAFCLSIPGWSRAWTFAPIPPLAVWLGASGYGCYRNWFVYGADGSLALGRSADCFVFILTASVPMVIALFFALRRARPLNLVPVLAMGALGVAGLAAAALQFFHPFDVTVTDLALHAAAVTLVVAFATLFGVPWWRRIAV